MIPIPTPTIPSPIVTLRDYLLSQTKVTDLVGTEGVIVGPISPVLREQMPRRVIQLLPAGLFESAPDNAYWKWRVQANCYGETAYNATLCTLVLVDLLTGLETVVIESDKQSQGLRARITDIQHEGGPIDLVDPQMSNVPLETTFWAVGSIRAEV